MEGEGDTPRVLVLTPSQDRADQLAQSMGRLADSAEHTVGALGSHWVLPERATMLFGTPADVLAAAKESGINLEAVDRTCRVAARSQRVAIARSWPR